MLSFLLFFTACGGETKTSDVVDGTYVYSSLSNYYTDLEIDEATAIPEGLKVTISDSTYTLSSDDGEIASGTFTLMAEDQWAAGCATNMSSVTLKSYTMESGLQIGDISYESPKAVPGCDSGSSLQISEDDGNGNECGSGACLYFAAE